MGGGCDEGLAQVNGGGAPAVFVNSKGGGADGVTLWGGGGERVLYEFVGGEEASVGAGESSYT
jgi:hypothetical protein